MWKYISCYICFYFDFGGKSSNSAFSRILTYCSTGGQQWPATSAPAATPPAVCHLFSWEEDHHSWSTGRNPGQNAKVQGHNKVTKNTRKQLKIFQNGIESYEMEESYSNRPIYCSLRSFMRKRRCNVYRWECSSLPHGLQEDGTSSCYIVLPCDKYLCVLLLLSCTFSISCICFCYVCKMSFS